MNHYYRKLYEPSECLALSKAQRRVVYEKVVYPKMTSGTVFITKVALMLAVVEAGDLLGAFGETASFLLWLMAFVFVSEASRIFFIRKWRGTIASFVRRHMDEIDAEVAHAGIPQCSIRVVDHPMYAEFLSEDPERRYIYWEDLPSKFDDWLSRKHIAQQE